MTAREREIAALLAAVALYVAATVFFAPLTGFGLPAWVKLVFWAALSGWVWHRPRVRAEARRRLVPFIILTVTLCAAALVVSGYAAGLATVLGNSPYSRSLPGILSNILLYASVPVLMEWVRCYLVCGVERARTPWASAAVVLLFAAAQTNLGRIGAINSLESFASFFGGELLPQLMGSLLLTYAAWLVGPAPGMLYAAIVALPPWLMPVLPDLSWLMNAIIGSIIPLVGIYVLHDAHGKSTREIRPSARGRDNPWSWLAVLVASVLIVWFVAGLFPVYPLTIMSGSMEPLVYPGDVVIVQKAKAEEMKQGDIVQYRGEDATIVHRIVGINLIDGKRTYTTKGDNNNVRDPLPVTAEQIQGKVVATIPKLGFLTYLLRSR